MTKQCFCKAVAMGFLCLSIGGVFVWWRMSVRIETITAEYRVPTKGWQPMILPLYLWNNTTQTIEIRQSWNEKKLRSTTFDIYEYGFVKKAELDGVSLKIAKEADRITLKSESTTATHTFLVELRSSIYDFPYFMWNMRRSLVNSAIYIQFLLSIIFTSCAVLIALKIAHTRLSKPLASIVIFGATIRAAWAMAHPFWTYSYDWSGHMEYVSHILSHWTIPEASLGWQTYQPPLYYFVSALWLSAERFFGLSAHLEDLQGLSLVLSIVTLATSVKIAQVLWPTSTLRQSLFLALLASFPGLVYLSGQISNDTLITPICFAWLLMMIQWEKSQEKRFWIAGAILVVAGILTKSTGLFLLVAQCSIAMATVSRKQMLKLCAMLSTLVVVFAGWLLVLRFALEGQSHIVGNIEGLAPSLALKNSFTTLLSFNPIVLLLHPFNNDLFGLGLNSYFLEYFLRSALFGSYAFPAERSLATLLMVASLAMLPMIGIGCIRGKKSVGYHSLLCTGITYFIAIFSYRFMYPMSPNQHFRFVTILIIPLAAFSVMALKQKSTRSSEITLSIIMAFCVVSSLFLMQASL